MYGINVMTPIRDSSKAGEMITFQPTVQQKKKHMGVAATYARALLGHK